MRQEAEVPDFNYRDERFADLQLLRYQLTGFEKLVPKQKELIYYLSKATLYGRDITFDQFGKYNLRRVSCRGGVSETYLVLQWHLSSLWLREDDARLLVGLSS